MTLRLKKRKVGTTYEFRKISLLMEFQTLEWLMNGFLKKK